MTIDPLVEADLDDVVRIEQESFSVPWTRKMFRDEFQGNPFASLVVGREAGRIVGHLCYWVLFEELRIMNLAVSADDRRRGIAGAMMAHAMTHGRTQGVQSAMLEVRASNLPAIAFYTRIGFQQIARREGYYSNPVEDAMIMRRTLLDADESIPVATTQTAAQGERSVGE